LNEFEFTLPSDEVQDASINILKFAALGTSLIVSRSLLGDGETLQSNFEEQLGKLEKQVQDLRYQPAKALRVGAAQD
ncbi:DcrB-related protein, partial [Escherichia coli]